MKVCLAVAFLATQMWASFGQNSSPSDDDELGLSIFQDSRYTIVAEGIRVQFVAYGASIASLFINDTNGVERDIVLGYESAGQFERAKTHPHLGGVPGRYANRIKNSSFKIDGETFKVTPNENNGKNTLHGGPNGWDYREFEAVRYTRNSVVFKLEDPDGSEGFPGAVTSYITYSVTPYKWHISMNATSTKKTPIMLTSHVYWNLDGFQNPSTNTALNHTLSLPFSNQRLAVDGTLIPTGEVLPNLAGSVNDFWTKPKQIGASFSDPAIKNNCGTGCDGYDNCWLVNRLQSADNSSIQPENGPPWWEADPVAKLYSNYSGIGVSVYSNQEAFQLYSCNAPDGSLPLKRTQGFFNNSTRPRTVPKYGCVVMEAQDWIDGINHPAWKREAKQIIGPNSPPYSFKATYSFSAKKQQGEL